MWRFVALVGFLALVGCSKPATQDNAVSAAEVAAATTNKVGSGPAKASDAKPGGAQPASVAMLAYSYDLAVEAAPDKIKDLVARHEAACAAAGPTLCEVTGSTLDARGRDNVSATLAIRAAPLWLARFRATIAADANAAGGRLARATTTSEDLSRQIVDTEAAVRAKTVLRDRLQAILETRPGKMSDLVELETSIAQIQGELDATQSELAMYRERVATSAMTIEYESSGVLAPEGTFGPLGRAIDAFAGNVVAALAIMVQIVSWLLPWVLVGGLAWVLRGHIARLLGLGRQRPAPPKTTSAERDTPPSARPSAGDPSIDSPSPGP